jgi:phosphatidylglycerophosphate synthase
MLAGSAFVAFGRTTLAGQIIPALAIALSLILDTADGQLARLQGTASDFGRWLDANLDELGDMALHAAIAWSAYARTGWVGWLLVGMAYAASKYLFVVGTTSAESSAGSKGELSITIRPGLVRRLAHLIGHADIRLHVWIVLAAIGRLEWALATYAAYFAARALGGSIRKAVRHAA